MSRRRRSLASCRPKTATAKGKAAQGACKSDFPFEKLLTDSRGNARGAPFDVRRHPKGGLRSTEEQTYDMQAPMAAAAGYFGGYTAKMQNVGRAGSATNGRRARSESRG